MASEFGVRNILGPEPLDRALKSDMLSVGVVPAYSVDPGVVVILDTGGPKVASCPGVLPSVRHMWTVLVPLLEVDRHSDGFMASIAECIMLAAKLEGDSVDPGDMGNFDSLLCSGGTFGRMISGTRAGFLPVRISPAVPYGTIIALPKPSDLGVSPWGSTHEAGILICGVTKVADVSDPRRLLRLADSEIARQVMDG